ncbi:MAG: sodium-dependent transporter [Victivallales bacterium]|nr:sodium-dependent transporter [Victivallales bacterium]
MQEQKRENWGSKLGFILATAGSAIGLGNVWRFPYITGVNGGGAFVLVFLLTVLFCGLPIMMCELILGRATHKNPVEAFGCLERRRSVLAHYISVICVLYGVTFICIGNYGLGVLAVLFGVLFWRYGFAMAGVLAVLVAVLINSYYCVIGGWILEYVRLSFAGHLADINTVEAASNAFGGFLEQPWRVILFHWVFLTIVAAMLFGGIKNGIERWSKVLMPMLFLLLLVVIVRSVTLPGAMEGIRFLFRPDFSKLGTGSVMSALGHSFYTLSLGMAIVITYGSYQRNNENLFSASLWVIVLDTITALLAGLAIFPAVFAMGFDPAEGTGLIFKVLPATFSRMPLGFLWSGLFFIMFCIAAVTSAASLLECPVTFLIDRFKVRRPVAIIGMYLLIGFLGVLSCLSIGDWKAIEPLRRLLASAFGEERLLGSWMDTLDNLCSNWIITIVALLTSLFVGWVWGVRSFSKHIRMGAEKYADRNILLWLCGLTPDTSYGSNLRYQGLTLTTGLILLSRFVSPVIIILIMLKAFAVI